MENFGLYNKENEHDSCGVGFIANLDGKKTHHIVKDGITVLKNLEHRGAIGGDDKTGDGAGMLIQIPHNFFLLKCKLCGFNIPEPGEYGVGMLFLPKQKTKRKKIINIIETATKKEGGKIIGWRDVPVNPERLGKIAKNTMRAIKQIFITFQGIKEDALERKLYILRKCIENKAAKKRISFEDFYIPSLSCKTIVYKGMFIATQFENFYLDLHDNDFISGFAIIHARYSTNTFPSWYLAQPFRHIAHNGEINTLKGNINRMYARQGTLSSELFGKNLKKLFPIVVNDGSDSAIFDNVFELLLKGGRSVSHTMMMMIPEAFGQKYHISEDKRAFYEYHAAIMEPWDGPAVITFTDGEKIGAVLDRNGLRPARYTITKSGKIILASEVGVLNIPVDDVLEKGRLAPGKMIMVDTSTGRVQKDNEIKSLISRQKLYRRWLLDNKVELKGLLQPSGPLKVENENILQTQTAFGYTLEDINMIIIPMAKNGQEPIGSMGDDEALAVLSERPQALYKYFKQLFAQVTNPPIDTYRENLVMSLMSFIGRERNLLEETPEHCKQLKLYHPILSNEDIDKLIAFNTDNFNTTVLPMVFNINDNDLEKDLDELCVNVEKKVDEGYSIIIISDKNINKDQAAIPALLAVSAINNYLVKKNKRHLTGLVVQSGGVKEVMDFAALIGFGASAVNPYLVFKTIAYLKEKNIDFKDIKLEATIDNYITAVKKGLLKIMSKMGISTIRSYRGAGIFEAIGLNSKLVNKYFPGLSSRIEGIGIEKIAREILIRHKKAFNEDEEHNLLESGGHYKYKNKFEKHLLTPLAITLIQKATREGNYEIYKQYSKTINDFNKNLCTLRGLFKFKKSKSIPIEEVESVEKIVKRFVTGAMSFGSISKEAHETIAIAMNRLGAKSNCGEGGEDEARYKPLANGDSMKSEIKQVASGRFGVTSYYLNNAKELQIKMAQGAKPGEGGQLPGHKVNEIIAKVRHSIPGVMLISPPPHHDIYSIEDLAELIYDLKNANPDARVSVKLVSEVGVGTIAAGVAKAKADMVLISGGDGGTGASPLSSIKHAGIPWEIGLAETQQTLMLNKLRDKIRVQVDGQIRTGRDVVIGALLGAEEFGFATIVLVTLGCVMMRKCHLNTCPVGVATQDERLRKRFKGKPEYVINFMKFIAQETREIMAELGFKTFDEMVGQVDRLEESKAINLWKAKGLDFSRVFAKVNIKDGGAYKCTKTQKNDFSDTLDEEIIQKCGTAIELKKKVKLFAQIRNSNRAVGARLSSVISRRYGLDALPSDTIQCKFTGAAGQSFGAFLAGGITFELEGDTNDYLGKGLSGGKIIVYPEKDSSYRSHYNIITGNVCLFGATKGEVYIHGTAGERFAVRNSGATCVVEGVGDHGCEYMTGGRVVILGKTGVNFAAGMSGGIAYVLDETQLFDTQCNLDMVDLFPVTLDEEKKYLYKLIQNHYKYTASKYAEQILAYWSEMSPFFVKVVPIDYRYALDRMKKDATSDAEVIAVTEEVFY